MRAHVLHSAGLAFLPSCIIVSHDHTGEAIIIVSELPVFLMAMSVMFIIY